jgi:hypothetical protein
MTLKFEPYILFPTYVLMRWMSVEIWATTSSKVSNIGNLRISKCTPIIDRLCGLVVRVLGYRSGGPGSIPGTTRKKVVGLERGPLNLVSTTEELLDRKVVAPV